MAELAQQISNLSDIEAIGAMDFVARWMEEEVRKREKLPADILVKIADGQAATELLSEAFPELSDSFQSISPTASEGQRGQIARNYLQFLAERDRLNSKVEEALDRPTTRGLLTTMAGAAAIYVMLSFEFEFEYEEVGNQRHRKLRLLKKSAPLDMIEVLKRILGL